MQTDGDCAWTCFDSSLGVSPIDGGRVVRASTCSVIHHLRPGYRPDAAWLPYSGSGFLCCFARCIPRHGPSIALLGGAVLPVSIRLQLRPFGLRGCSGCTTESSSTSKGCVQSSCSGLRAVGSNGPTLAITSTSGSGSALIAFSPTGLFLHLQEGKTGRLVGATEREMKRSWRWPETSSLTLNGYCLFRCLGLVCRLVLTNWVVRE